VKKLRFDPVFNKNRSGVARVSRKMTIFASDFNQNAVPKDI
jgi:hypothetical protein